MRLPQELIREKSRFVPRHPARVFFCRDFTDEILKKAP
jgi:hypothetical protein